MSASSTSATSPTSATSSSTTTSAAGAAAAADADAARRQKEHVEKLLARPAALGTGSITLGGRRLEYETRAVFLPVAADGLASAAGEPQAAVMATSYTLAGAAPAERAVCFAFNGGPGSASIWLHLGALGPKRVVVPDDGSRPRPPYAVEDNPHSWFAHFDLVFVDPPHTGWSVCANEAARKKMLSVDGDVEALAEVIRGWLTRHRRWGSAVYIAGESYGTTRGAAITDRLIGMGVDVAGIVLVSCAMDLQSIVFAPANDLPYALFLPAFANVAQYHGLLRGPLAASPAAARAAAEAFVHEEYLAALHAGARLDARRRSRVARRLAELTGLPRALVEEKNLRIADEHFFFEALRSRGLQVGRLDARVTGPLPASRDRSFEFDPGIESIEAPYTMAAMAYFREQLGLDLEQRYEVLNLEAHRGWNWSRSDEQGIARMGFASTSPDLARALRRNPHLKVLAASGRYDLGTPYSASDWSLAQLNATPEVLARVQHRYYDAGHMMYTRQADLVHLEGDLAAWLRG
jgi:carboxypeptidase C (cathepsin A)